MIKKFILCLFLILFIVSSVSLALPSAKKGNAKAAPKATLVEPVASGDDAVADLKEDMNNAVADLKGQIDKVKSDNSDAKVSGQIFFRWQDFTSSDSAAKVPNFDIDRVYINIKKKLNADASARITFDVARLANSTPTSGTQHLFDYLKYAFVELPTKVPGYLPLSLTAKIGLQHTVWIDWADSMLGLRFLAKSLLDNEGVMSSADFGLGALGKISVAGLPEIEYHATILNGSGYKAAESDSKKAVAARVNSTVLDNEMIGKFIVGAFANVDSLNTDLKTSASSKQAGIGLGLQNDLSKTFLEYVAGSKSSKKISGYSLGTVVDLGKLAGILPGYNVFARFDMYDPDSNAANNENNRSLYGVTYDWGKDVKFALDWQNLQVGGGGTASTFYLNALVNI